ncbi:MAG TPA: DUF2490 domain-containing protein [Chryseolinea sp.]|nr:DUF2490 domain-containing protein [Chryseolinea sp.]
MSSRILCLLIFGLFCSLKAVCQTYYSHDLFWFRMVLADTINKKIKWEVHLQNRTQDAGVGSNFFSEPQLSTIWTWINFSLTDNIKLGITPFSYFNSHVLYAKPSDLDQPAINEYRWVVRLDHEQKGKFLNLINRVSLEYRLRDFYDDGNYTPNYRARFMFRLEKPVKLPFAPRPVTLIAYDEVMLQFGEAVKGNANVFDQNRIYGGLSYPVYNNIKLNVGYIYGFQQRISGDEFDRINTLWVVLTFDNLISQFTKKGRPKEKS